MGNSYGKSNRIKNQSRDRENRSHKREVKQLLREGRFDELKNEEPIYIIKEPGIVPDISPPRREPQRNKRVIEDESNY